MMNATKPTLNPPDLGFLLDGLRQQGFVVGIGDMLEIHRYFDILWGQQDTPLSISDLKAQLAALVCQNFQQQQQFYTWFDKWAAIIQQRTANIIDALKQTEATVKDATDVKNEGTTNKPIDKPIPPSPTTPVTELPTGDLLPKSFQKSRKGPINIQLTFPIKSMRFWNLADMDAVLLVLREKKWDNSTEWDIPASIRQTIQLGGIPEFVLKQKKQTPQYLMLIEQQSNRDHQAAFYAELAEELGRRDLNVFFFYYDITPNICWRERNNPRTHVSLEQLQGEYADARLFIVGSAETLLKTAQLEPSSAAISIWETWKETAILNPKATGDWGKAELAIGQLFPVIPINSLGFKRLAEQWNGSEHFTPAYWQIHYPEPRTPLVAEFDTLPRFEMPMLTPDVENNLNLLYFYLRDSGYRWLCATALYPELYYELTHLYADKVITPNPKLGELAQNQLWWESLRLLVRLDWFRKGHIQTYWRYLLREDFTVEQALLSESPQFVLSVEASRKALLNILELPENTEGIDKESYAAANQAFTKVWLESEIANNVSEIPQKMEDAGIYMSDIEDGVGRKLWYVEQQKLEKERTIYQSGSCWWLRNTGLVNNNPVNYRKVGADAKVEEAWQVLGNLGNSAIIVAVIDDDFDLDDPVLKNRAYRPSYLKKQESAFSFSNAAYKRGTNTASLAIGSQSTNFSGVAPNVQFMPIYGIGMSIESVEHMFHYPLENSADIIICAWGTLQFELNADKNAAIAKAARHGRNGKGCVILFTSGNEELDDVNSFAKHPDIICVAASTSQDEHAEWSNTGAEITVCAPTESASGATAVAGGICALILSANPNLTAKEVKNILIQTADKIGSPSDYNEQGHSKKFGYGRVNAAKAVKEAMQQLTLSQSSVINEPVIPKIDPLSTKPRKGSLLYDIPDKMELGKVVHCSVQIAYEGGNFLKNITDDVLDNVQQTIDIVDVMSVELMDKNSTPTFKIICLSKMEQAIDSDFAQWLFTIEPLRENSYPLTLKIEGSVEKNGKSFNLDIVTEKVVDIKRSPKTKKAIVNKAKLNVYINANTHAKVVGTRVRGTEVLIFEEQVNWCRIGVDMWVEKQYLTSEQEKSLNMKAYFLNLIADGRLKEALTEIQKIADTQNDYFRDPLILLQSRFNRNEKENRNNLVNADEYNIERNRIENAVISLIKAELDEDKIPDSLKKEVNEMKVERKSKIYFSWAWNENYIENEPKESTTSDKSGKDSRLIKQLSESFKVDGYDVINDVSEETYKGSLIEFIKEIGRADFIIVVISDKFLKSEFCMYELYEMLRKDIFKKIYLIYTEVIDLSNPEISINYFKYWEDTKKRWEQLITNYGKHVPPKQQERYQQVKDIRNELGSIIAFLNDLSGTLKVKLSENNFSKVKETIKKQFSEREVPPQ